MITHDESWQLFSPSGTLADGQTTTPDNGRGRDAPTVGAAHVWMWRHSQNGMEVLLQKRSATKPTWPGYLDISAAGHIDGGESGIDAALREAQEELGIALDPTKLEFVMSYRNFDNGFKWMYLYQLEEDTSFDFTDGEVESLEWVGLDDFASRVAKPEESQLVPHPAEYFSLLLTALKHFNAHNVG